MQLHVPFVVEQEDDGTWIAEAAVTPDLFVSGEGETRDAALDDLRTQIARIAAQDGVPDQLVVDIEIP